MIEPNKHFGWNNHHRSQPIGWPFICAHLPWLLCEATRYSSLGPIHQHCSSAKTRRLVVRVAGIVQGTTRCQSRKAFYPRTKSGGRSSNQDSGDFLHGKNEHLSVSSLGRNIWIELNRRCMNKSMRAMREWMKEARDESASQYTIMYQYVNMSICHNLRR